MKKLLGAILFVSSMTAGAQGVVAKGGSIDCGEWLDARKTKTAGYYEHYLLGLIDGMSLGRVVNIWAGKGGRITVAQYYYWMDTYCEKNPLQMTVSGAYDFANEMSDGYYTKKMQR